MKKLDVVVEFCGDPSSLSPPQSRSPGAHSSSSSSSSQVRKNHACEACGKAFRDVYHLNRHRLSHSDEKPYSCPVCQQRFKRKDRMSYHVRSHQGGVEKPYVCPHCAKAFSRPDHLNSHVRQVHSTERPFKCTCKTATQLQGHMGTHANQGNGGGADPTSSGTVGSTSVAVTVSSAASAVGLLVTDCSSIVPQTHS
ncbi:hypothetical protein F2P81_015449 [Scophthalmus maximus]|uniref:C2H2-type domain-containing protein n=1 Tax=Scophthalmus maximus TaxID=52904 RepID=A0A6A4SKQ5_SCOMX|nr:hypothetical protein F2P81_015449 [Scophthalmus maximus]